MTKTIPGIEYAVELRLPKSMAELVEFSVQHELDECKDILHEREANGIPTNIDNIGTRVLQLEAILVYVKEKRNDALQKDIERQLFEKSEKEEAAEERAHIRSKVGRFRRLG